MATSRFSLLLALSAAALVAQPADRYPVDWKKAATHLKQILEHEGIPCQLFALEPDRANLIARLKGSGAKRPLLVMGHTDVVGVQKEKWTFDPFTPTRKDGFVYARGAVDDKDNATAGLMLMVLA
jgi:acetylornithine deacetylase/succinyl-diaminopimelate desuccinylase-like protein